ncbi:MAG: amidohydrolase family protein [Allomuricauda sp.]
MIIDAHVHLNSVDDTFLEYAIKNNIKLLSIITDIPTFPSVEDQLNIVLRLKEKYPDHVDFVCTFPCWNWGKPNWLQQSLDYIERGLEQGAVGVKVWKNIGMSITDTAGQYVMIDHPSFEPIFKFLEDNNIVLLGHVGEPKNCWLPLEEMTVESDKEYFRSNPEYHMFNNPSMPSYDEQLNARDKVLDKHPDLKFVGLHLASLEWSVQKVGEFLDKFPNTMVDLAERICHLQFQAVSEWKKVYDFFIKYQDRIIYGTDIIVADGAFIEGDFTYIEKKYTDHREFFLGTEPMRVPKVSREFNGLGLPKEVVQKIYVDNALKAYPRMKG